MRGRAACAGAETLIEACMLEIRKQADSGFYVAEVKLASSPFVIRAIEWLKGEGFEVNRHYEGNAHVLTLIWKQES